MLLHFSPSDGAAVIESRDEISSETVISSVERELRRMDDVTLKFRSMEIDATEYACLKGLVLFKTGKKSLKFVSNRQLLKVR